MLTRSSQYCCNNNI